MDNMVVVETNLQGLSLDGCCRRGHRTIALVLPLSGVIADVHQHTPSLARQASLDIPRGLVRVRGRGVRDLPGFLDALHDAAVPPAQWRNMLALTTQGSIGLVSVAVQKAVWPLVLAELPRMGSSSRKMRVDLDEGTTTVRKQLRLVEQSDEMAATLCTVGIEMRCEGAEAIVTIDIETGQV